MNNSSNKSQKGISLRLTINSDWKQTILYAEFNDKMERPLL